MEKHCWITSTVFLELLALSQCLPGPTSTQVSFALGVVQKGVSGGLLTGRLRHVQVLYRAHNTEQGILLDAVARLVLRQCFGGSNTFYPVKQPTTFLPIHTGKIWCSPI